MAMLRPGLRQTMNQGRRFQQHRMYSQQVPKVPKRRSDAYMATQDNTFGSIGRGVHNAAGVTGAMWGNNHDGSTSGRGIGDFMEEQQDFFSKSAWSKDGWEMAGREKEYWLEQYNQNPSDKVMWMAGKMPKSLRFLLQGTAATLPNCKRDCSKDEK